MNPATLVPESVDVAETVRVLSEDLQDARDTCERLRIALSRISGFCAEARADAPSEEGVAMGALSYINALARDALR